jgi:hypothetical protein
MNVSFFELKGYRRMEFVELLDYARVYKNEENTYYGVRDILEEITDLDNYEFNIFEMLREEYTIKQSIQIIRNSEYSYYTDIYEYVSEYFENSGIKDLPYWVDIDYKGTFENIRIESNLVYTTWDSPFIKVYY